jgi:hypothetical protein
MASEPWKLARVILAFLVLGVAILSGAQAILILGAYPERSLFYVLLRIFFELGIAIIIASIVAFVFERLLSEERIRSLGKHLGRHQENEIFGFRRIYADRQEVFDQLFKESLPSVQHQLKIMGICVSLFKEAEKGRPKVSSDRVIHELAQLLQRGARVQVLFLKRYPSIEELGRYGIEQGDFFFMRERDEDDDPDFLHGKRLKKIANRSLGEWIRTLLKVAEDTQNYKPAKRKALLKRMQIREYLALPSLSLYIADEDIYITPYLYKRHCSDVPAFHITGRNSALYKAYDEHFAVTWNNTDFTSPAISEDFVELLAEEPREVLKLFKKKHSDVRRQLKNEDSEDPEFFRDYERTIDIVMESFQKKRNAIISASVSSGGGHSGSHSLNADTLRALLLEEGIPLG